MGFYRLHIHLYPIFPSDHSRSIRGELKSSIIMCDPSSCESVQGRSWALGQHVLPKRAQPTWGTLWDLSQTTNQTKACKVVTGLNVSCERLPTQLMCLNPWIPAGGAVVGSWETFWTMELAGRCSVIRMGLEDYHQLLPVWRSASLDAKI